MLFTCALMMIMIKWQQQHQQQQQPQYFHDHHHHHRKLFACGVLSIRSCLQCALDFAPFRFEFSPFRVESSLFRLNNRFFLRVVDPWRRRLVSDSISRSDLDIEIRSRYRDPISRSDLEIDLGDRYRDPISISISISGSELVICVMIANGAAADAQQAQVFTVWHQYNNAQ